MYIPVEIGVIRIGRVDIPEYIEDKEERHEYVERNFQKLIIGIHETEPDDRDYANRYR